MDFLELVKSRYACRSYQPRPDRAGEASAGARSRPLRPVRLQPPALEVHRGPGPGDQAQTGARLRQPALHRHSARGRRRLRPHARPDDELRRSGRPGRLAIAMEHLSLAATAEGLATCWIGAFSQDEVREVLGVPATVKVIELMTLGYPADAPRPKRASRFGDHRPRPLAVGVSADASRSESPPPAPRGADRRADDPDALPALPRRDAAPATRLRRRPPAAPLCPDCAALLDYSLARIDACRFGATSPPAPAARSTASARRCASR